MYNAELLSLYQQRFRQVHVDEFQDTNTLQYAWLKLLTCKLNNLFAVGDDDQSIYGWRGAKIEHIYNFQQYYPKHQLIRLEQNYRSSGNIINVANAIIAHNNQRLGKELWTEASNGEDIALYEALNEQDEAYFVVERIKKWTALGNIHAESAILYRSNAQSRAFEAKLISAKIPYRIYGGLRFFERAEIKNVLAYLRLAYNNQDDASFERIINTPPRGIGNQTQENIRTRARIDHCSLWQATQSLVQANKIPARTNNSLRNFLQKIKQLTDKITNQILSEQVKTTIENSDLMAFHAKEKDGKGEARLENLKELVVAAEQFSYDEDNEDNYSELDLFLAHTALEAGDNQGDQHQDCVQLMTLHSSKGLEFKQVFIVGLEDGLFPSRQSADDVSRLEEERRLFYVGITRAMQVLYLTYAESRNLYGNKTYSCPSQFIKEIPSKLLHQAERVTKTQPPIAKAIKLSSLGNSSDYKLGQRIIHAKFGEGIVLQIKGEGTQEIIQINFANVGMRWLMLSQAQIKSI